MSSQQQLAMERMRAMQSPAALALIQQALLAQKEEEEAENGQMGNDEEEEAHEGEKTEDTSEGAATSLAPQTSSASTGATDKQSSKRNRFIEFSLQDVNPYIVCKLCAGYFIKATTITECLHTFCRSCIVKYLHTSKFCPTCGKMIHETNPFECLRQDRTIQSIVFKIVKDLQQEEANREREYWKSQGRVTPPRDTPAAASGAAASASSSSSAPSAPTSSAPAAAHHAGDGEPQAKKGKLDRVPSGSQAAQPVEKDEQIYFVLEKLEKNEESTEDDVANVTSLEKPYIRTSSKATISHLKKFLAKKLGLQQPDDVDILCRGEVLGRECSLEFIQRTRWRKNEQLVLKYRPRVDFEAP